jgi:hypothetical protein
MKHWFSVAGLLLVLVGVSPAQESRGTILGRVTDAQQAAVPGVSVVVRNTATGVKTTATTNESGDYYAPFLVPGTYELAVERTGFRTFRQQQIEVGVQARIRIDVDLVVGELAESVTVSESTPLLEMTAGSRGDLVTRKMVEEVPLSGRSAVFLTRITPGVSGHPRTLAAPYQHTTIANFDMSGGVRRQNEILLDGVTNTTSNYYLAISPSTDAVEDMKVQVNAYDAEYGRTTGGVINAVTKSGTNKAHGTLSYFHQNKAVNASDFFSNQAGLPKPPWIWNNPSGSLGGPVYLPKIYDGRNRTFFFFNYEGLRHRDGRVYNQTVPTPMQLEGNFSETRNSSGALIQVYDPFSTRANPASAGRYLRDVFPGNIIPSSRLSKFMAPLLQYYPKPSRPGDPFTATNNRFIHDGNQDDNNMVIARIDHALTSAQRFSGRVQWSRRADFGRYLFGEKTNPANPSYQFQPFGTYGGMLDYTNSLSPSWLLNIRYGYSRYEEISFNLTEGFDLVAAGLPTSLVSQMKGKYFPRFDITGFQQMGREGNSNIEEGTHTIQAVATKILGSHNIRAGTDYRLYRKNNSSSGYASGYFRFNAAFTQGPDPTRSSSTAGFPLASALLGTPNRGDIDSYLPLSYRNNYAAAFLQDDWRLSRRLTLNLGLRYDHSGAWRELENRMTRGFAFDTPSPLKVPGLDLRGGLLYAGVDGQPSTQAKSRNNISPRFGFAYQLAKRTVVRGGYGLIFSGVTHFGDGYDSATGFSNTTAMVPTIDGVTPLNTMSNPYPQELLKPVGSSLGLATLLGQSVNFFDPSRAIPRTHQYSLTIGQQLGADHVLEASYSGSRATNRPINVQWNQLSPETLKQYGDALLQSVPNPFYRQIDSGILSGPSVTRGQLLRPFPHFDQVTENWSTRANSSYDSLQTKFQRRFSQGISATLAYTFSKRMGEVETDPITAQNNYDLRAERAVDSVDTPHRLSLGYVMELPFGRGKRIGANAPRVLNRMISGWQFSGAGTLESGNPLSFSVTPNTTNALGGGQRTNSTGVSAHRDSYQNKSDMLGRYFDTAQFLRPATFTFGNVSRRTSDVRGPTFQQIDLSLSWKTALKEKAAFQFRLEAYNALNRANFSSPNTSLGNSQFGRINSLRVDAGMARVLQFGAKITF